MKRTRVSGQGADLCRQIWPGERGHDDIRHEEVDGAFVVMGGHVREASVVDLAGTCRVVVADDAPDVRTLLRAFLEDEGFTVVGEARDGNEAVELARRVQPDVMLLDLSMPGMDGLKALPLVVEASPGTAVIVLSGFVNDDMLEKVRGMGAAVCVEKGMNLPGLVRTVRDLCPASAGGPGATAGEKPLDP